jgi:hypothetical protein
MEISAEQVKYKISDVGINHLEAGTVFKKPDKASGINITNIKGVTVVGGWQRRQHAAHGSLAGAR